MAGADDSTSDARPQPAIDADALEHAARRMLTAIELTSGEPPRPWSDLAFDEHALELFHAQYAAVPTYRAWCDHELARRAQTLSEVRRWSDVPALPIAAFKRMVVRADAHAGPDAAEWWSSGTTGDTASRHHLRTTDLYDASLAYGAQHALLPDDPDDMLAVQLAPSAADAPRSSLSHMLDMIRTQWCEDGGAWVSASFELDAVGAWGQLESAARTGRPVLLLSTSFGLVQLLEHEPQRRLDLPARSRVMDTGGYKGRTRELTRDQLLANVARQLGVQPAMCENEYGMSELSSQAWLGTIAATCGRPLPGTSGGARWQPPWMRTRVVDPATLEPVDDGEQGLLVHHDLANVWSCAAIRSEDVGVRRGYGYELVGRAAGAELRGCSLQLEDVL